MASLFITCDSAHKTSRKTAGDNSRNPQMCAAYSALGMLGEMPSLNLAGGLQRQKASLKDHPKAFRDPATNISLETPFLKKQVTPMGNCQETNK